MNDLDQHLAGIDELLAGNTRPLFDEKNPQDKLPEPEEAVLYRSAPGTRDKGMARDLNQIFRGEIPSDNMPNVAKPAQAPLAVLGGRGMAKMMDRSPPELAMSRYPNRATPDDGRDDGTTPSQSGTPDGSTQFLSPPGPGDLPAPAPQQGGDMITLLRNLFQGAL